MPVSTPLDIGRDGRFKLARSQLKDQAADLLREHITSGRIRPGTKLTERVLAEMLGVSRMPARDALLELEKEGLIIAKPGGRRVVAPDETDIRRLFHVRVALEELAVGLAALHCSPSRMPQLLRSLEELKHAIQAGDRSAYVKSDLMGHRLIWEQTDNPYLLNMLNSIVGPIMMFIASQTELQEDWDETYRQHADLVKHICAGDVVGAQRSIAAQLDYSLKLSLRAFQNT